MQMINKLHPASDSRPLPPVVLGLSITSRVKTRQDRVFHLEDVKLAQSCSVVQQMPCFMMRHAGQDVFRMDLGELMNQLKGVFPSIKCQNVGIVLPMNSIFRLYLGREGCNHNQKERAGST